MGFWSTVGKIAVGVVEELKKQSHRIEELKKEYRNKNDDDLIQIIKNQTGIKRGVAFSVLKERGWSPDDLKFLVEVEKELDELEKISREIHSI